MNPDYKDFLIILSIAVVAALACLALGIIYSPLVK